MKFVFATVLMASAVSFADIKVEQQGLFVKVDSVTTEIVGHGHPSVRVKAVATFGNSCAVPRATELAVIPEISEDYRKLDIQLVEFNHRICPRIYQPVTVTLDLGVYTKPNDGLFEEVKVNDVLAQ